MHNFFSGDIQNKEKQSTETSEKGELKNPKQGERKESSAKDSSNGTSPTSDAKVNVGGIPDKAVVILKKKAPALSDKVLNPEFFQKLETRGSDDLPVEVVVPRRYLNTSSLNNEEEADQTNADPKGRPSRNGNVHSDDSHGTFSSKFRNKQREFDDLAREKWPENGKDSRMRPSDGGDDRNDLNQRESSSNRAGFSKSDGQSEGSFINNKGNWLAIQRQLLQLERQQAHLMNMLQVLSSLPFLALPL